MIEKASIGDLQLFHDRGNTHISIQKKSPCFLQYNVLTVLRKRFSGTLLDDTVQVLVIIMEYFRQLIAGDPAVPGE